MTGTSTGPLPRLSTPAAIREFLRTSPQPVFYVSRTATNLLGVEQWVGGLSFVTMVDSWDGKHPSVFVPTNIPRIEPRGNINIVNWLLRNPQVQRHIAERTPPGLRPRIVVVFLDETTKRLCRDLGYDLALPPLELRTRIDSKIVTTKIGNAAGVSSVPNILTHISSWTDLTEQARAAGLGSELVVQTAYGDSGQTTFFISDETAFDRVAPRILNRDLKVMKRIAALTLATEAVITRHGVVLGPCLREIIGHSELTRFPGGWCGNEMAPAILSPATRARVADLTRRFSDQLARQGFRGTHDVSMLVDTDTGEVYFGEVNPRISGSATHSNLVADSDVALPLIAFHLLEFSDVEFDLDVDRVNAVLEAERGDHVWTSMIVQHTEPTTELVVTAPKTGRYRIEQDGSLTFIAHDLDWRGLEHPDEVFVLRVLGEGEQRSHGSDLAVVFARFLVQDAHGDLRPEAHALIRGVQDLYGATPVSEVSRVTRAIVRRAKLGFDRLRRGWEAM